MPVIRWRVRQLPPRAGGFREWEGTIELPVGPLPIGISARAYEPGAAAARALTAAQAAAKAPGIEALLPPQAQLALSAAKFAAPAALQAGKKAWGAIKSIF